MGNRIKCGTVHTLAAKEAIHEPLLPSQELPDRHYGSQVVVVEVWGKGNMVSFLPIVAGGPGIDEVAQSGRWYLPLESPDHTPEIQTKELKYGCSSNKPWAVRWVDVRKQYRVETEFLLPYTDWKMWEWGSTAADLAAPLSLENRSLELLQLYYMLVPGTLAWLPTKTSIAPDSVIFRQQTKLDFFYHPVLIADFEVSTGMASFYIITTMGNKTVQEVNSQTQTDGFFNRVSRQQYVLLQDKIKSKDLGFEVITPGVGKGMYSGRLTKQSFVKLITKYCIEGKYLKLFRPDGDSSKKIVLDAASLEILRVQAAKAQEHPLGVIISGEGRPLRWKDFEEGFVCYLPPVLSEPSVVHAQTKEDSINIFGLPCLVTGTVNGMVKIHVIWNNGQDPITRINRLGEYAPACSLAIDGFGAQPHDDAPILKLRPGSPQFRSLCYVKVDKEYWVEYTNLKAWSTEPIHLDAGEVETLQEYRVQNQLYGSDMLPETMNALRGQHPYIPGLAISMSFEEEGNVPETVEHPGWAMQTRTAQQGSLQPPCPHGLQAHSPTPSMLSGSTQYAPLPRLTSAAPPAGSPTKPSLHAHELSNSIDATLTDSTNDDNAGGRRIYIGNLIYQAKASDVHALFTKNGFTVKRILMDWDHAAGRNPSFCFVELPTPEEANRAIATLNGRMVLGRPVKAGPCVPRKIYRRSDVRFGGDFR
ncbi:uncharacterized protein BDZ99DRAFT_476883 [Mytilinidion resinicola]|uniref:RRM domain-containing protein n=1 Tax=Mytilinidion resinicola TaxID=574789 RepID=A0A6A6YNL7_9PEZI|nr:uncharacterized protein BDZ99DRAFT_476883 [Mytilinidion resinicola]KAF2809457.1 hypothetical protein BDZ99DRAFT_476883 [Mytilinidion resinicola]